MTETQNKDEYYGRQKVNWKTFCNVVFLAGVLITTLSVAVFTCSEIGGTTDPFLGECILFGVVFTIEGVLASFVKVM